MILPLLRRNVCPFVHLVHVIIFGCGGDLWPPPCSHALKSFFSKLSSQRKRPSSCRHALIEDSAVKGPIILITGQERLVL
jgi:hypothetical protein